MTGVWQAISEVFERGGPVMWPLLVLSVVSVALSVERALFWARHHRPGTRRRLTATADALRARDDDDVRRRARADHSLYAGVLQALLVHPASDATGVELVETRRGGIERFGVTQSTIIAAAPLLGILGTVLGIIESFELLGEAGAVVEVNQVAGGIAEALITTAFGLTVALITLFPHMAFRAQADRSIGLIEMLAAARLGARAAVTPAP